MMTKTILFLGFGLLPLWISIAFVVTGGNKDGNSAEYWAVAPWFVIAAIPVCAVTLAISAVTVATFNMTSGSHSRKLKVAIGLLLSLIAVGAGITAGLWWKHESHQKELAYEELLVLNFVRSDPKVIAAVGSPVNGKVMPTMDAKGINAKYDVVLFGQPISFAVVNVSRTAGTQALTLVCITRTAPSPGKRDCNP